MVRSKVNRFTIQQDTTKSNNFNKLPITDRFSNPNYGIQNSSNGRLSSNGCVPTCNHRPLHIKMPSTINANPPERDTATSIRKKLNAKEAERDLKKSTQPNFRETEQMQEHQQFIREQNEKLSRKSDASLECTCKIPSKKVNRQKVKYDNAGHRTKQKYYIIDNHGDNNQVKQTRAFSDESLECMEIMKAAISDVVQDKIIQITEPKFQAINNRLDSMTLMIRKNEMAICECFKELRAKIQNYGEDTSKHLKYLCMKLEYEKLMSQNFHKFLDADITAQQQQQQSCIHRVSSSGFCTQRQRLNICHACTPKSCCCCQSSSQEPISKKFTKSEESVNDKNNQTMSNEFPIGLTKNEVETNSSVIVDLLKGDTTNTTKDNNINKLLPNLLNNFLKFKINSVKIPKNVQEPPADGQNVPILNGNAGEAQDCDAKLILNDIETIEKYYNTSTCPTMVNKINSDIDTRDGEDDTEDTEESKGSIEEESEENYCENNENGNENY